MATKRDLTRTLLLQHSTSIYENRSSPTHRSSPTNRSVPSVRIDDNLRGMKKDQKRFFIYTRDHISKQQVFYDSTISMNYMSEEWRKSRDNDIRAIYSAVNHYINTMDVCKNILRYSYILTEKSSGGGGGQNNVGFSFPGFDSQVFNVGGVAVFAAWNLFEYSGQLAFTAEHWDGATKSNSAATQLMQCSPDCTPLFEAGKIRQAKELMHEATLGVLHNLCLACYYKHATEKDKFQSRKISWKQILGTMKNDLKNCPKNKELLKQFKDVTYHVNVEIKYLLRFINSLVRNYKGLETRTGEGNEHPSVYNIRFLYDPVRWLAFLGVLVGERRRALAKLRRNISTYLQGQMALGKKKSKHFKPVQGLQHMSNLESKLLQSLEKHLPTKEAIENILHEQDFLISPPPITSSIYKRKKNANTQSFSTPSQSISSLNLSDRFPQANCTVPDCQISGSDFIPLACKHCGNDYCPRHASKKSHSCGSNPKSTASTNQKEKLTLQMDVRNFPPQPTVYVKKNVIFEGYLRKCTKELKVWESFWVVLQHQFLYAFSEQTCKEDPIEVIDLRLYSSVEIPTNVDQSTFIIKSTRDTIAFECSSQEELTEWVEKINIIFKAYETLTNGVNWHIVVEVARAFGISDMDKIKANALAPQLGDTLKRLGFMNNLKSMN